MSKSAKHVLNYWLKAIEALAAESLTNGEESILVGRMDASYDLLLGMGVEGGARSGSAPAGGGRSKFNYAKDIPWQPAVLQVLAAQFQGDHMVGHPVPVLAVPCDVTVVRGQPTFRPPQSSLIPSVPKSVLVGDGEDKDGIVLGTTTMADEWLRTNGGALEAVRASGSWAAWWRASMSLLGHVTSQTIEDPLRALPNELTNAMLAAGSSRHVEVAVNVVDTGSVPNALINLTTTMKALIESDYLEGNNFTAKLLSGRSNKTDFKLGRLFKEAANHVGLMDKFDKNGKRRFFSLDPDQRTAALRHFANLPLSAVTGPPGTGKTSTMTAIVGDAIVRPLLGNEPMPNPKMILATGPTNQAVTNIIDGFGCATTSNTGMKELPLTSRWVDKVPSFGWYGPSRAVINRMKRAGEMGEVQASAFDSFQGFARQCRNPQDPAGLRFQTTFYGSAAGLTEYYAGMGLTSRLYNAATTYLDAAADNVGTQRVQVQQPGQAEPAIERAIAVLRGKVKEIGQHQFEVQDALWNMISTGDRGPMAAKLGQTLVTSLSNCGPFSISVEDATHAANLVLKDAYELPPITSAEGEEAAMGLFHKVQAVLDGGPRLAAFHYASRYWEGRWLLSRLERLHDPIGYGKSLAALAGEKGITEAIRRDMDELLYLAPCIVATAHTMPTIFGIYGRPEAAFGIADEMIVDEAGQASQDLIVPVTAFARRGIVLGDVKQIEPVRSITPERDTALLRSYVLKEGLNEADIPAAARISYGSTMQLATESSDFTGLTLRYHYRCRPEIISWSNDRCYGGALIPVRPSYTQTEADSAIPTLGYVRVSGRATRNSRGSVKNSSEAYEIANYLHNNKTEIEARFGKPLHECVAIISPYTDQKGLLQAMIGAKFKEVEGVELRKFVIGSVHQLQGAQREMILFSTAATPVNVDLSAGGALSFDKTDNILNVARSRAMESFIVFAAPSMLDRADNLAFGSMAQDITANGRRLSSQKREPDVRKQGRPGADFDQAGFAPN